MVTPTSLPTAIRTAGPSDTDTVLSLIRQKAEHDGSAGMLELDSDRLRCALSGPSPRLGALLAERIGDPVGVAVFFRVFSTYLTRPVLWLEDLFVCESVRSEGVGRALMRELCRLAVSEGATRVDWAVRVANERAIAFYLELGAELRDYFTLCRLDADGIAFLARPDDA